MLAELKSLATRNAPTLLADAIGLSALIVMLLVGLHAPGLV